MSASEPARGGPNAAAASGADLRCATAAGRRVPLSRQVRLWLAGLVGSRYDGLHNFAVVEPGVLLRCGQPHVRDLETIRREHGLRAVVAARGGTRHPLRGRWFAREAEFCRQHGIRFEHMPFSDSSIPPADVFDRFVRLVAQEGNRPLLVHCEQGFHRTGILVAAYRVRLGGWKLEDALAEMRAAGFDISDPKRRRLYDALVRWAESD